MVERGEKKWAPICPETCQSSARPTVSQSWALFCLLADSFCYGKDDFCVHVPLVQILASSGEIVSHIQNVPTHEMSL